MIERKNVNSESIIYGLYEIFSKGVTNTPITWTSNDKVERLTKNFIKEWESRGVHRKSLGVTFLYDYFCYAYNYWTNNGEEIKIIPLEWIIGKPQFKRWDIRHESYQFFYQRGFLSNVNIPRLSLIKRELGKGKDPRGHEIFEEYERQRFHNTPEGFINCLLSTSLVTEKSKWCNKCKMKEDCIDELKTRDKRTALKRGYTKL